mmetsp:Transcript_5749/g.10148  ORF Transcript_5749/g.10148 Transcript_5749/m.10148 type:complete len:346 (-) Transcript_5749:50-1087(-)
MLACWISSGGFVGRERLYKKVSGCVRRNCGSARVHGKFCFDSVKMFSRLASPDTEYVYSDEFGQRHTFPSLFDAPSLALSVVVPAYNEQDRLPAMLEEAIPFLEELSRTESDFSYEVIVADDGSRDRTSEVVMEYTRKFSAQRVRLLRLRENAGKGAAVRRGVMIARGNLILFCDADGATRFSDFQKLRSNLFRIMTRSQDPDQAYSPAIVIGSRYHLNASVQRDFVRRFVSLVFNLYVQVVGGVLGIQDTQCGFKLFTRSAARIIFPVQHLDRWAFDVELLYLAQQAMIPILEVPVNWVEIPGSKLSLVKAILNMSRDMAVMRWSYTTGSWAIHVPEHSHMTSI